MAGFAQEQPDPKAIFQQFVLTYRYNPGLFSVPGATTPGNVRLKKSKHRGNSAGALSAGLVRTYRQAGFQAWMVEGLTTGRDKGLLIDDSTLINHTWVVVRDSANWIIADPALGAGEINQLVSPLRQALYKTFGIPFQPRKISGGVIEMKAWDIRPDRQLQWVMPVWDVWQLRTPPVPPYFLVYSDPIAPWCEDHPSDGPVQPLAALRFAEPVQQLVIEADGLTAADLPGKTRALHAYLLAGFSLAGSANKSDLALANGVLTRAAEAAKGAALEPRKYYLSAQHSLNSRRDSLFHTLRQVRQTNAQWLVAIRGERNRLKGDSEVQKEKIRALGAAEARTAGERSLAGVRHARKTQEKRLSDLKAKFNENRQYVTEVQTLAMALKDEIPPLALQQQRLYAERLKNLVNINDNLGSVMIADAFAFPTVYMFSVCDSVEAVCLRGNLLADSIKGINDSIINVFSLRNRLLYRAVLKTRENRSLLRSMKAASQFPGDEDNLYHAERDKLHELYGQMKALRYEKKQYNQYLRNWLTQQTHECHSILSRCRHFNFTIQYYTNIRTRAAHKLANSWLNNVKAWQSSARTLQTAVKRALKLNRTLKIKRSALPK